MAERKNTHGLQLFREHGVLVIDIGDMEIWDGADLSLVRDTLTILISEQRHRSIGIEMSHVKFIPSGFFGMLYDWYETGIRVHLFRPRKCVTNMLWFQRFFEPVGTDWYRLEDLHEIGLDAEITEENRQEYPRQQPVYATDSFEPLVAPATW